ncbi:MAG: hypothetical protein ACE14P_04915 [Methanotrichaceae archaeon]
MKDEKDHHLTAGAAGVGAALGANFAKVKAVERTKVVCSGGENCDVKTFFS